MSTAERPLSLPLLTAEDVAAMLPGTPVTTVRRYAREGRLPAFTVGRRVYFNRPDVEDTIRRAALTGRGV